MYIHQGIIMHIAPYNPAYSHKLIEKWWVLVREINLKWCSVHVIIIIMAIEFTSHWDLFRNLYCKYVNKNHFCCIIFNATKKATINRRVILLEGCIRSRKFHLNKTKQQQQQKRILFFVGQTFTEYLINSELCLLNMSA